MSWPLLNSHAAATVFWGWAQVLLGAINFAVLGFMLLLDVLPFIRRRNWRSSVFGMSMLAVSLTSGLHAIVRGYFTINGELTPTGVEPLDIASLIVCFGPLPVFGIAHMRARSGRWREWTVKGNPAWLLLIIGVLGIYAGGFLQRFLDTVRFHHIPVHWARFDANYNLVLWGLYLLCAHLWLRYQVKARKATGRWSVSGMALGLIFVTMSLHRLAQAIEVASGAYVVRRSFSGVFLWVDASSVLAATAFLVTAGTILVDQRIPRRQAALAKLQ